ncbi:hypothetical protein [Leptolyngbya sp. FACHB-261]|uniref:hypothetical protein n=1 Tax=Leptolyngbya sp. FACHB-261 TaxID=2692806 RepID=UPI0016838725|nr:hypothetical protein [Leptolyngbya sp. FACHB-261]MBD2103654.1 hypothetical protein [Leptolyngbya sp. FACHB-261]
MPSPSSALFGRTTVASHPSKLLSAVLKTALQRLVKAMIVEKKELQVWQESNGTWHICDPMTQAHHRFSSEDEARIWIDQRYHFKL